MAVETVTLREHLEALRAADIRFGDERDRRNVEVNAEREKALKIKEEADKVALTLARQIQDYKDEKANDLRSQIERERGDYGTKADVKALEDKFDAVLKPVLEFVAAQAGGTAVSARVYITVGFIISALGVIAGIVIAVLH
jgi:hypothetical protein